MIRVLVVDDEPIVRDGLSMILTTYADLEVVGTAADGAEAWQACGEAAADADVMLLDLRMPVVDGLTLLRQMRAASVVRPRTLVLTTFDVDDYVREALRLGAAGFLLKSSPHERIAEAVRAVHAGERVLGAGVIETVIGGFLEGAPPSDEVRPADLARVADLTARERQILQLLGEGRSNSSIAGELFVSLHTVKTHVSRVLAKTGCANRSQAAALALRTARHLGDAG